MQLRFLLITGPNSAPASIEFGPGLNVIYGGSNTGKSHVLRLIDFVLGSKNAPEPIVEQAAYDMAVSYSTTGRSGPLCARFKAATSRSSMA